MKRRLNGLFLVCIMCVALTGCGKHSFSTNNIAQSAMEQFNCVPINESNTMYYNLDDYSVIVLNDYYTRFGEKYAKIEVLIVDEKIVYYDINHYYYTTEPPLAD